MGISDPKQLDKFVQTYVKLMTVSGDFSERQRKVMKQGIKEYELLQSEWDQMKVTWGTAWLKGLVGVFSELKGEISQLKEAFEDPATIREAGQALKSFVQIAGMALRAVGRIVTNITALKDNFSMLFSSDKKKSFMQQIQRSQEQRAQTRANFQRADEIIAARKQQARSAAEAAASKLLIEFKNKPADVRTIYDHVDPKLDLGIQGA